MGIIARAIKAASGTINFLAGSAAKAAEVNSDFNTAYTLLNGEIDNDNIASDAAIAATKLATIATAGKVSGAALTGLDSIPAGAGVIPSANLPVAGDTNLTTDVTGILPIANGGTGLTTASLAINGLLPDQATANGKYLTSNGSACSWGAISVQPVYTPDETSVIASALTEKSETMGLTTKLKEITLYGSGSVSVSFELKAGSSANATAWIYKNGSVVGTERVTNSTSYVTYVETIASLVYGDKIQIYANRTSATGAFVKSMKILATQSTIDLN